MDNVNQKDSKSTRLKILIIVLTALLVLSTGGLAARFIYLAYFVPEQTTATVTDNMIGNFWDTESGRSGEEPSTTAAVWNTLVRRVADLIPAKGNLPVVGSNMVYAHTANGKSGPIKVTRTSRTNGTGGSSGNSSASSKILELYKGKPEDNERFEVKNMFPGDVETRYFCVKAHHKKDITLYFKTDIVEQTKNLGDVLHIKVTRIETSEVLYDAPFNEINGKEMSELLKANSDKESIANYRIDVSLDHSVGNEYQAAMLKADFKWYVKEDGGLTPPQTGDTMSIILWIVLAVSSLLLLVLILKKRRKEVERHEQA